MAPSLEGVDLKLGRADKDLRLLHKMRETFLSEDRSLNIDYEADSGDYVLRYLGEHPSPKWGLAVSEFAHMLRTALDNFLWQLLRLRGRKPREGPDLRQRPRPTTGVAARVLLPQAGSLARHQGRIPARRRIHQGGAAVPTRNTRRRKPRAVASLSMLGYLNNVDKHRFIHPAVTAGGIATTALEGVVIPVFFRDMERITALTSGQVNLPAWGFPAQLMSEGRSIPFQSLTFRSPTDDPTEVARFAGVGSPYPKVEVEEAPAVEISLSGIERPMSLYDFDQIGIRVGEIVNHFRREFV